MGKSATGPSEPTELDDRFRAMYAAHFGAILSYALRRVAAAEDAADVVAETFLIAWRRCAEVPLGSEARLWLYGAARRVLANHVRGEGRRSRLGERLRIELTDQAVVRDPADEVVQVRTVREAMARLDRADLEVLELTAWEQLAPREIAVALGLSPQVVRARLSRARARLREQLDEAGADPVPDRGRRTGHDPGRAGHIQGDPSVLVPREDR